MRREALLEAARYLKDEPALAFDVLMDLTAADYLKFGASQSSAPRLATPSPLPYYMTPKPVAEIFVEEMLASEDEPAVNTPVEVESVKSADELAPPPKMPKSS